MKEGREMQVVQILVFSGFILLGIQQADAGLMKWNCKPNVNLEDCKQAAKKIFENVNCDSRDFECNKRDNQYFCSAFSRGEAVWDSWKRKACRTSCADADGAVWWHADYNQTPEKVVLPQICPDKAGSPVITDPMKADKKSPDAGA